MTALVSTAERPDPRRAATAVRVALTTTLAVVAVACLTTIVLSQVHRPASSPVDVLLLAGDLIPLVVAFVAAGFIVAAPGLTPFSAYLTVALVLYTIGATRIDEIVVETFPGAAGVGPAVTVLSCFAFLPCAYLFPNGRLVPVWSGWLILGWVAAAALALAFPWDAYPPAAGALLAVLMLLLVASLVASQVWRYRRVSTPVERQQTKWVLVALVVQVAALIVVIALPPGTIAGLSGPGDVAVVLGSALISTALSVSIAFAMLRYRLFDVDLVIGRAAVWVALTVFVAFSYAVVVGVVGLAWPEGTPIALPVAATAVVAVGTEPVRRLVQRAVNRRLYGLRDEPALVLERLGEELATSIELQDTLDRIAQTVARALRLPRVDVETITGARAVAATDGAVADLPAHYALEADGDAVGTVRVSPRRGERLSPRDDRLIRGLCRPAALAVRAALLTAELRASAAALTAAREEERRHLQRELHDGVGPTLASLQQRVALAERLVEADPHRARELLRGARSGLDDAVDEVRGVVAALRPAVLDRHGVAAGIALLWRNDPRVRVTADSVPPLDAAVALASYRIATEAIANALRHSACHRCDAVLTVAAATLIVRIADDGCGVDLAAGGAAGNGLRTMRERATEVGGTFAIRSSAAGTLIEARLPLSPGSGVA